MDRCPRTLFDPRHGRMTACVPGGVVWRATGFAVITLLAAAQLLQAQWIPLIRHNLVNADGMIISTTQDGRSITRVRRILIDGEVVEWRADGSSFKRKIDALDHARTIIPSARFARVFPGDSIAKLAAEHGVDAETLALLNRTVVERVFASPDVICLRWTHKVRDGETLEKLAGLYNIEPRSLARLNRLAPNQPVHLGQELLVPGEFQYEYQSNTSSSFTLTQYLNESALLPFDRGSMAMRFETIQQGESFEDFLTRHDLAEDFVRTMNDLGPDQTPDAGDQLLVEYSLRVTDDVTLDRLAVYFEVPVEELSEVNGLEVDALLTSGRRVQIPLGGRIRNSVLAHRAGPEWAVMGPVAVMGPDGAVPVNAMPDLPIAIDAEESPPGLIGFNQLRIGEPRAPMEAAVAEPAVAEPAVAELDVAEPTLAEAVIGELPNDELLIEGPADMPPYVPEVEAPRIDEVELKESTP